jgi:hypothetical protein
MLSNAIGLTMADSADLFNSNSLITAESADLVNSLITAGGASGSSADSTDGSGTNHGKGKGKEKTLTHTYSQAEVESILALQFSEPLPKVMGRVQKASKTMPVSEAMQTAGHMVSENVQSLLGQKNQSARLRKLELKTQEGSGAAGGLQGDAVFAKAMAFLNSEFILVREKLDLKLLECGFFKLVKEKLLYETQDKLDEIAMDMGLAEATMESCQGEIQKQTDIIAKLTTELNELTRQCKLTHDELFAAKQLVEEDLRVINLILNVTREECVKMGVKVSAAASASLLTVQACLGKDGHTYFESGSSLIQDQARKLKTVSSQQAFQRALFEVYGFDSPLPGKVNLKDLDDFDDEETDDFPDGLTQSGQAFIQTHVHGSQPIKEGPDMGTSDKPSMGDSRERCNGVTAKPNCRKILDKLGVMKGEILDRLEVATKALQKWDAKCEMEIAQLNGEIGAARSIITIQTTELQKATAFHNGLSIEHGHQMMI